MDKKIKSFISVLMMVTLIFFVNANLTYAISASSNPEYEGIDVSHWQGYIDYSKVKESGIDVVYIKSSQGSNIKDPYFEINYENAKANGLKVGFYHFLTATNTRRSRKRSTIFCICDISEKNQIVN